MQGHESINRLNLPRIILLYDHSRAKPQISFQHRLRGPGICYYDELIHDRSMQWILKNFSQGTTDYPIDYLINVARLVCSIIWQTGEWIISGDKPSLNELIHTFNTYILDQSFAGKKP